MQPLINKSIKNDRKVSFENALKRLVCFSKYQEQKIMVEFLQSLVIRLSFISAS